MSRNPLPEKSVIEVQQQQSDWPLAEVKARLGEEFYDVVFFAFLHLLTLPFIAKAFSKHSKQGVKHNVEVVGDIFAMWFETKRHSEMEAVLLHANHVHATLNIQSHEIHAALATFAVATHDWLKSNTTIPFGSQEQRDLLQGLLVVGKIMNLEDTPQSIEDCREVFYSKCDVRHCSTVRPMVLKGLWVYWRIHGLRRLLLVLFLFPATVPSPLHRALGAPRLPAPFYRMVRKMIRVRWHVYDLLYLKAGQ